MDSADAIDQARSLYKEYQEQKCTSTENDNDRYEKDIKRFIYIGIKQITPVSKLFVFVQILDILKHALKIRALTNGDVHPVAKAFDNLECYFLLLVEQPWKPEFKMLKMYGGFYRTKIRSVLLEPETIFRVAGYDLNENKNVLEMRKPVQRSTLLDLAFDCRVASAECRNIETHYNRLKCLGKSIFDAISDVLHDPSFLSLSVPPVQKPGTKSQSRMRVGGVSEPVVETSARNSFRKPLPINGHADLQPLVPSLATSHQIAAATAASRLPSKPFHMTVADTPSQSAPVVNRKLDNISIDSPLVVDETLVYFGDTQKEVLPDLSEGTSEDHMRESLRMLENHKSSKHLEVDPGSRSMPPVRHDPALYDPPLLVVPEGSNRYSALTYPPAFAHVNNPSQFMGEGPFVDEGIGPTREVAGLSKHFPSSSRAQPTILPNKASFKFVQTPDQGYHTGSSSGDLANYPSGSSYGTTSRHPGAYALDGSAPVLGAGLRARGGANHQASQSIRQAPPIPPRELKPSVERVGQTNRIRAGVDCVDGPASDSAFPTEPLLVNLNGALRRPNGHVSGHNHQQQHQPRDRPLPVPANVMMSPSVSAGEPSLRRSRMSYAGGRSGSLKTGDLKNPVALVVSQSRETRSMDFTHMQWECQHCTALNVASDTVCYVCSHSRHGNDDDARLMSGEPRIVCTSCTFENASDRTHCEMCNGRLNDYLGTAIY